MPEIRMIPVDLIDPHPHNPRRDLGDLTELADSIRAHGIRQNLLLVPIHPDWPCEQPEYWNDDEGREYLTRREFFARILAALGLRPKHEHTWRTVGYGGAGWYLLRCDECGAKEIA